MEVSDNRVQIIPLMDNLDLSFIEPAHVTREWFDPHMYKCLPLSIANQYGFILRSPVGFEATWVEDPTTESDGKIDIKYDDASFNPHNSPYPLVMENSFGRGILTIYPRFIVKTPPLINTWVKQPPNVFKAGVDWMEGMVETDNLNSTFTFNIKFHFKGQAVRFEVGDPLGSFIPFPRFFFDDHKLEVVTDPKTVGYYRRKDKEFLIARERQFALGFSEYYYKNGKDFQGCPFNHAHQVSVNKPKKKTEEGL